MEISDRIKLEASVFADKGLATGNLPFHYAAIERYITSIAWANVRLERLDAVLISIHQRLSRLKGAVLDETRMMTEYQTMTDLEVRDGQVREQFSETTKVIRHVNDEDRKQLLAEITTTERLLRDVQALKEHEQPRLSQSDVARILVYWRESGQHFSYADITPTKFYEIVVKSLAMHSTSKNRNNGFKTEYNKVRREEYEDSQKAGDLDSYCQKIAPLLQEHGEYVQMRVYRGIEVDKLEN